MLAAASGGLAMTVNTEWLVASFRQKNLSLIFAVYKNSFISRFFVAVAFMCLREL